MYQPKKHQWLHSSSWLLRLIPLLLLLLPVLATASSSARLIGIEAVAPDVLSITLENGKVDYASPQPYVKSFGDQVSINEHGPHRWLSRRFRNIGSIIGRNDQQMFPFDRYIGEPLATAPFRIPQNYSIYSEDDDNYLEGQYPTKIYRKTKPIDVARVGFWDFRWVKEHKLYLHLPSPLQQGASYRIHLGSGLLDDQLYTHQPQQKRSESVHISHLGFRPDDPAKVAFLSLWKGSGSGHQFHSPQRFTLIDSNTNQVVFSGESGFPKRSTQSEDNSERNYNNTDVHPMDFSAFNKAGDYRLCVGNIGCSYPFTIANNVWKKAFITSSRGLYHQRSGTHIGAPHSTFKRPRNLHPDDGFKVYAANVSLMDTGNGLNARGLDKGNFRLLNKHRTDTLVADAWGGYADAGDWDRRIQHLRASRYLLELWEMFPQFFSNVSLNIPESNNALADIIDEALWGLDFFQRLQTPEGGIRGGIESANHPRFGEGSWQESQVLMTYKPGMWSSYIYAGVAARAAHNLQNLDRNKANSYLQSAQKAMAWAEKEYATHTYAELPHKVDDARNLAAIELYRLTKDEKWHQLFIATTAFKSDWRKLVEWKKHNQGDAAFIYARLSNADATIKNNIERAFRKTAAVIVKQGKKTAFRWTKPNPDAWIGWGMLTVPKVINLLRAHYLLGDEDYLSTSVYASQFGAGANPANMMFTTGLGHKSPQHPLHQDQRVSGQSPPEGITVNGPHDIDRLSRSWTVKLLDDVIYPSYRLWPTTESYLDIYTFEPVTEFTVHSTLAPNAYVWGYLAAR